ncbi:MAG: hypothetical protein ACRDKH_06015 [Solirubrobacterales bacterium]
MEDPREGDIAEDAEDAARRYEEYKASGDDGAKPDEKRLRGLKRVADRAKLALHRKPIDD